MRAIVAFLVALPCSYLPPRYRPKTNLFDDFDLRPAAAASGVVQTLACAFIAWWSYIAFLDAHVKELGGVILKHGLDEKLANPYMQYSMGIWGMFLYLAQPRTLVLIYFAVEGVVRFMPPIITGEVVGTLPLYLVAMLHNRFSRWDAERALPPLVADRVEHVAAGDHELRIWSCRPRPSWDHLMTVSYEDQLYEVVRQELAARPRPFVYMLRKRPEGKVVRGLHHYHPDELLPKDS